MFPKARLVLGASSGCHLWRAAHHHFTYLWAPGKHRNFPPLGAKMVLLIRFFKALTNNKLPHQCFAEEVAWIVPGKWSEVDFWRNGAVPLCLRWTRWGQLSSCSWCQSKLLVLKGTLSLGEFSDAQSLSLIWQVSNNQQNTFGCGNAGNSSRTGKTCCSFPAEHSEPQHLHREWSSGTLFRLLFPFTFVLCKQRLRCAILKGSSVHNSIICFFLKVLACFRNKNSNFYMQLMMTPRLLKASNILKGRIQAKVFSYDKVFDGS